MTNISIKSLLLCSIFLVSCTNPLLAAQHRDKGTSFASSCCIITVMCCGAGILAGILAEPSTQIVCGDVRLYAPTGYSNTKLADAGARFQAAKSYGHLRFPDNHEIRKCLDGLRRRKGR